MSRPPRDAPRVVALLGGTIGNFPPGTRRGVLSKIAAPCSPPRTGCCSAPTWSRTRRDRGRLQRLRGRHRGVQPQPAARRQPRARRRLRTGSFEHVAFYRPAPRVDRDAAARRPAPARCWSATSICASSSRAGEEMRTEISAKFTRARVEADLAAAGLELTVGSPTPRSCSGSRSRARGSRRIAERRARVPPMQIAGSGALVAGGASGLGEATVRHLHRAGAQW